MERVAEAVVEERKANDEAPDELEELRRDYDRMEDSRDHMEDEADKFKKQRNEILRTLLLLMVTRRKDATREEAEEAFNEAKAVINKYKDVMEEEMKNDDEVSADKPEKRSEDLTLAELVDMVTDHKAGMISYTGRNTDTDDGDISWIIVAATGYTAEALQRWALIDYDHEPIPQWSQAAYAAYGAFTDNKNFQGNPMPAWEDLPEKIRGAWQAAAHETAQLCLGQKTPEEPDEPDDSSGD